MPKPTTMVPVSDYIKKLLFQYDCLVVPELGGFILRYLPAEYAEGSDMYLPPRKKVAFNEALKLDDGLLISYIMLHEGCSREEVVQHIRAFVDETKQRIRKTGSYQLEGVGLFSENEEGRLQFEPEFRHNFLGESFGFQPIAVTAVSAAPLLPSIERVSQPAEEVSAEQEEAKVIEHPALQPVRPAYWRWVAAVLLLGSVGVMSYFTFSRVPGQLASSLNPFDIVWTVRDLTPGDEQKIAPAPLVEKEKPVPVVTPQPEVVTPAAPTPVAPSPQAVAPVKEPAPVAPVINGLTESKPAILQFKYLAIAGSFSSKKNARKLQRQLRRQGYTDAIIVNPDAKKGLIKVAAFGFNRKSQVEDELSRVSELTGVDAWVSRN